jgi:hypothetical protein
MEVMRLARRGSGAVLTAMLWIFAVGSNADADGLLPFVHLAPVSHHSLKRGPSQPDGKVCGLTTCDSRVTYCEHICYIV